MDTLIIGAGMAGLRAAALLRAEGQHVTVVDKGRRHGGRMATRRVEDAVFDTGVLDLAAHSAAFRSEVSTAAAAGHAAPIAVTSPRHAGAARPRCARCRVRWQRGSRVAPARGLRRP